MGNSEKNGNVKWRDFGGKLVTILLTLLAIIFTQFVNGLDKRFNAIEKSIDIILQGNKTEIQDRGNMKK